MKLKIFTFYVENACGGMLYAMMGTFTTPNYPSLYPRNTRCLWILKVPFAKGIKLQYDDFDLEESSECRADRVIATGPRPFQATKICGTHAKGKVLRGNVAMIEFMSNGAVEKRGFKARYESLFRFEDDKNKVFQATMEVTRRQAATNPGLFIFIKQTQPSISQSISPINIMYINTAYSHSQSVIAAITIIIIIITIKYFLPPFLSSILSVNPSCS